MEFEEFARSQHPQLVAVLTLYCGDRWAAEGLAQDALVRARERWTQVADMEAPGPWVHRVAINLANSRWRRRDAERRAYARLGFEDVVEDPCSAEVLAVREAVASLPSGQRGAILCRYFLDLSVTDTAGVLGLTPGSVKSATHRGLATLRDRFGIDVHADQEARDDA